MGIMERFQEGGIFMYFILLFGLFTLGFIIERANSLYYKMKPIPADFRQRFLDFISRGDWRGAENYAQSAAPNSSMSRIASTACQLRANSSGEEELQARMDERLAAEISQIDRRTGFLAMFGNVATLLGLLGTITGMIHSFAAVASASPSERATMLSKGISEAMNCTAFGLIVAIPALVAYAIFQNRIDRIVTRMTELTTEIYHDLLFLTESDRAANRGASDSKSAPASRGGYTSPSAPTMSM